MIQFRNLSVLYPNNKLNALSNINITFFKGEFVCILGQSGAGKSTLIRCMNGLQKPTSGMVYFNGNPIFNITEDKLRKIRREMGMIFQQFHLIPRLTVNQNVLTGMFGYRNSFKNVIGWYTKEEKEKAKQVITDVGLSNEINRRVENLSGGQKQRVGIARAVVQQPCIFLGDEPVSSLDPSTADRIFNLLNEIHERHDLLTIINVHDVELAKQYATRIIGLRAGEIVFDGKPNQFNKQVYDLIYSDFEN